MNDEHVYFEGGVQWNRVYTLPNVVIDANPNPMSNSKFVNDLSTKKGNVGDLLDRSKELSEKRAKMNGGRDPIQDKWFDDYKKKRKGKAHPADNRNT